MVRSHTATDGLVTGAGIVLVLAGAVLVVLQAPEDVIVAIALGGAGLTLALILAAGMRGQRVAARSNQGHDHLSE